MSDLSRRSFIVSATAGAAALVGGAAVACADANPEDFDEILSANVNVLDAMDPADTTYRSDVVVLGAGPGGIACATRLGELGLKVQVIEKTDVIGGTGLYASGNCYISLNSQWQMDQGLEADIPAFYKEWLEAVHYHCDHEVLSTYLRNCGRVVDWLLSYGFEFYMKDVPATNGLSGNEYRISQPSRDGDIRPNAYAAMMDVATSAGGSIAYSTVGQELIIDSEGSVRGVRCVDSEGATVDYLGEAVVIATGGYAANRDMVEALCNVPLLGRDPVQNCGEGAKMAWAAGAKKPWNLGILCCDTLYPIDENYLSYPNGVQPLGNVMGDLGKSLLHVNDQGERFHSEDAFCWVPTYAGANAIAANEPWLYVVVSQQKIDEIATADSPSLTQEDMEAAIERGVAYYGETAADLATAMGWDVTTFENTLTAYNACCEAGEDPVFFKGADYLVPIVDGPLYAVRFAPTPFGSCGDLAVNSHCQVRANESGTVVPNLYAVGTECVGVMHNDYYWALGQTVGWAHTSGVLAAEDIAAKLL
jgi:fumarate reductase flavoprotein subunit